jgi:hypothetical protein
VGQSWAVAGEHPSGFRTRNSRQVYPAQGPENYRVPYKTSDSPSSATRSETDCSLHVRHKATMRVHGETESCREREEEDVVRADSL